MSSLSLTPELNSRENVVAKIASIQGPADVYCWFEGPEGLSQSCINFMKKNIIVPLSKKKTDAKICLYSLKSWSFEDVFKIEETALKTDNKALEWVNSSDFFQYCANPSIGIAAWVERELPQKKWLYVLSETKELKNKTVQELFNNKKSLFSCIEELDVSQAYSLMQYIEGFYLVQRSIRKGLEQGREKIEVVFALPNDEWKYYEDFPKDIDAMLKAEFGSTLNKIEVNIAFQFFQYTKNIKSRPYLCKDFVQEFSL